MAICGLLQEGKFINMNFTPKDFLLLARQGSVTPPSLDRPSPVLADTLWTSPEIMDTENVLME
jgi:hypothetical protein